MKRPVQPIYIFVSPFANSRSESSRARSCYCF